jgi:hypothetical protein
MLRKIQLHLWRNGISPVAALAVLAMVAVAVFLPHTAAGLASFGAAFPLGVGMVIDIQTQFSKTQALTATTASTNLIDYTKIRNVGVGEPMAVVITVDVALAGTTPTFQVDLQSDDNVGFASPASLGLSKSFSALAVGAKIYILLPAGVDERFLRLNYVLGGTTPTITVTSELVPASFLQNEAIFPSGFTISS